MVQKVVLENGLTVLVETIAHSQVTALHCGFKIGSIYENADEGGICHLIEHMLFKGTAKRPKAGQVAYDAECLGADINAFTSFENTVYHLTLSSRYFKEGLEILSDMVMSPLFDPNELEREKEVVCEEIRRGKDSPSRVLGELLFKTSYRVHPYRFPIIGTEKSVKSFTAEKLHSFYRKWYGAKNAVLAVVSNLPAELVLREIERYFSAWQGGDPVHPFLPEERAPARPKLVWQTKDIQGTYFDIAWPIPRFTHPDVPALDLFSHVLGEGDASRLETEVKEKKQLVQSIHSYAYTPKDSGLFVIGGMALDKQLRKAAIAIFEQVRRVAKDGVSEEELERALLNVQSERYYEKQSADGIARKLIFFECTAGSWESEKVYYDRLSEVSVADVIQVARSYLKEERFVAAVLSKTSQTFTLDEIERKASDRDSRSYPGPHYKRGKTVTDISSYRLRNGVRVLLRPVRHLPIISMYAGARGGSLGETSDSQGQSHLIARLLAKGTSHRSGNEIAIGIERMAGILDGFSGRHSLGLCAQMLADKKVLGFDLFFDVLKHAAFPKDKLEHERFLTLEAIRQQEDSPSSLLWKHFLKALFPRHPYGMTSIGVPETVKRFTAKGLKTAYEETLKTRDLVVAVVGDFKEDWVLRQVDEALGVMALEKPSLCMPARDPKSRGIVETVVPLKKAQAHIALGFHGPTLKSADRYALSVLNTVLAGQGGRLFLELRDKQSLAYSVTSYLMEGVQPGFFALYIACDPSKVDQAIAGMKLELAKICDAPIMAAELARAKHQIVSGYEIDLQRYSNMAHQIFVNELHGLPMEDYYDLPKRYEAVNEADVLAEARHYIDLNAYTLCVLRP
jgi:zinc protease